VTRSELVEQIKVVCVELSGQAVDAAHYLINNFDEVPFHSMREVARRADIPPVNFVRLAQKLGYKGYNELRKEFIDSFPARNQRDTQSTSRNELSVRSLNAELGEKSDLAAFVDSYFAAERSVFEQARAHLSEDQLHRAAEALASARRVFVMGRRTAFPPAFALSYALQKARPLVTLLDTPGGAPESALDDILPGDVFVAVTFAPFNRLLYRLAGRAALAGATIIAITDSFAAPVGELSAPLHFVAQSSGRAFPESALGAITVANLLAVLTIHRLGKAAEDRIRENERFLVNSGEYLLSPSPRRRRETP
jgi:DNA-binding MurR/RpiR family transcriptional regulator